MSTRNLDRRVRSERLEARVTPAQKALFRKAASLQGYTLTEFLVNSITEAAQSSVQKAEVLRLSERDGEMFVKALLKPGTPNRALRSAASWYKKATGQL